MATCFCGDAETNGRGEYGTYTYRTKPRPTGGRGGGWADTRQVSGYLEVCETCGEFLLMNDDGEILRAFGPDRPEGFKVTFA